jgi:hypothetical protein
MISRQTGLVLSAATSLILLAAAGDACAAPGKARMFRAGAYAMDVTPEQFPVDVAGNMTPWKAEFAHDPLYARCLVLDDGHTTIAIAICDSCMIPREIFDAAKTKASQTTGIATNHILCAATHSHTAVTAARVFQSTVESGYAEFLTERIAQGIAEAHAQLEPVRIGWAVGNNPRQVFNRRWRLRPGPAPADPFNHGTDAVQMNPAAGSQRLLKPAGPVDPEVPLLAVQALDGRPIAVLANYSLHYVGGVPPKALSADYFGEFAKQLARLVGQRDAQPAFVGIMSNGTSGNINNINFFEGSPLRGPFEQIRLVAVDVAESAQAAYQRIEWQDWAPIAMKESEIELGVRRPSSDELARAKEVLHQAGERPYTELRAIYASETLDMAEFPETVRAKLQAIRVGAVGIASSPCETFVETGLTVKRDSPLPVTFTIELANGYNGYLPTPEQHALGGYETWRAKSSYLAVDAEPKVRGEMLRLLGEVAK